VAELLTEITAVMDLQAEAEAVAAEEIVFGDSPEAAAVAAAAAEQEY
jgi:hypothetical protein